MLGATIAGAGGLSGNTARHVIIRGRVQGVGFRAFVEIEAERLSLRGWVRNRRDNSVEALFAGPVPDVDAMIAVCRRGPTSARVDDIAIRDAGVRDLALCPAGPQFVTLPTL